jgi:hypothetical protein
VLPILAICLFGLFFFVAMAIDLGMLAVARTQCQNAADDAALIGCRNLNNAQPGNSSYANNKSAAIAAAQAAVPLNNLLSANFTSAQVQSVTPGVYAYNTTSQTFSVSYPSSLSAGQSWTAMQAVVNVSNPTYFMKLFGVTTMPTGATATAVHRPRDTAFVLDMTGSMKYACYMNYNNGSMNPDPVVPSFGHYGSMTSNLVATANAYIGGGDGEVISLNNYTITTPGGPPIIQNFVFDPANVSNPTTSAFPITSNTSSLINAFGRWSPPVLVPGDSTTTPPTAPTYDFTGYDATNNGTESSPKGPTPAPYNFQTMTDSASPAITYVGDRYRRLGGLISYSDSTWSGTTYQAATCDLNLLGYQLSGSTVQTQNASGSWVNVTTSPTVSNFRDPVWETYGYDLNIPKYITWRKAQGGMPVAAASYTPTPTVANGGLVAQGTGSPLWNSGDNFKGFSMGPGYWGKTFFIWPPDPRFSTSANLTSPNTNNPAFDTSGNAMCDWRRRFFLNTSGNAFTAQSTSAVAGINASLLNTSAGNNAVIKSSGVTVNYPAVLAWIKTGPMVVPPNLRAGRVLYYSSIPTAVTGGSGQVALDQVFWKNYIDYVLGVGSYANTELGGSTVQSYLYGPANSWSTAPVTVYGSNLTTWTGPSGTWTGSAATTPYMSYSDSPLRPRLHMWFGPLSLCDFIANNADGNWNPGTCYEAQCWQLKAAVNSVLSDLQANHPNDQVGLEMFSWISQYRVPRVPMGQNYVMMKNALFYPNTLLSAIGSGDVTSEFSPYNSSFSDQASGVIPNANGGTDPNTGLAVAFNLLSPSSLLPSSSYGTTLGRMGASKVVIFETDGVPNSYTTNTFNQNGYNSYYSNITGGADIGNGQSGSETPAIAVVTQMLTPMATTTTAGTNSGLALGNAPVRVYPIAFGDLFDTVAAPNATFRPNALQFLANIAAAGGTGASGATTIPVTQQITGPYATRIANLKSCLSTIFQSGVSVTLVQ